MADEYELKKCSYVFRGNFVHSTSQNEMEIMQDKILGISTSGKVSALYKYNHLQEHIVNNFRAARDWVSKTIVPSFKYYFAHFAFLPEWSKSLYETIADANSKTLFGDGKCTTSGGYGLPDIALYMFVERLIHVIASIL